MDGARAFLHRKEQKATKRRLKREPVRAQVVAEAAGVRGLLTLTPTRLIWARRHGMRTPVFVWHRKEVKGAKIERKKYGILRIRLDGGKALGFHFGSHEDRDAIAAIIEPKRPVDPIAAAGAKRPHRSRAMTPTTIADDPWDHLGGAQQAKRAVELYKKGLITKQEMEWQLAARS